MSGPYGYYMQHLNTKGIIMHHKTININSIYVWEDVRVPNDLLREMSPQERKNTYQEIINLCSVGTPVIFNSAVKSQCLFMCKNENKKTHKTLFVGIIPKEELKVVEDLAKKAKVKLYTPTTIN